MINMSECHEEDEEFKNAVDLQFEFVEHWINSDFPDDYEYYESYQEFRDTCKPSEEQKRIGAFAIKQFKAYKLAAGKAKSILISCSTRLAPFAISSSSILFIHLIS